MIKTTTFPSVFEKPSAPGVAPDAVKNIPKPMPIEEKSKSVLSSSVTEVKEIDEEVDVKKPSRSLTKEDVTYIQENVKDKSYKQIADDLNITKSQVSRKLQEIRNSIRYQVTTGELTKEQCDKIINEDLSRKKSKSISSKDDKDIVNDIVGNLLKKAKESEENN